MRFLFYVWIKFFLLFDGFFFSVVGSERLLKIRDSDVYSKPAIKKFTVEIRNARLMFRTKMVFARRRFLGSLEVMLAPRAFSPIATSWLFFFYKIRRKWLTDDNNESVSNLHYNRSDNKSLENFVKNHYLVKINHLEHCHVCKVTIKISKNRAVLRGIPDSINALRFAQLFWAAEISASSLFPEDYFQLRDVLHK